MAATIVQTDDPLATPNHGNWWGWCWGPKGFRAEVLELIGERQGRQHHGEELKESEEQKAERVVVAMLHQAGWTETELKERPEGDRKKARMAARLRQETTVSWPWIAKRLEMGHWRTSANAVRARTRK